MDIISAISTVGFPIVCSVVLAKFCVKNYNRIVEQNEKLIDKVINKEKDSTK